MRKGIRWVRRERPRIIIRRIWRGKVWCTGTKMGWLRKRWRFERMRRRGRIWKLSWERRRRSKIICTIVRHIVVRSKRYKIILKIFHVYVRLRTRRRFEVMKPLMYISCWEIYIIVTFLYKLIVLLLFYTNWSFNYFFFLEWVKNSKEITFLKGWKSIKIIKIKITIKNKGYGKIGCVNFFVYVTKMNNNLCCCLFIYDWYFVFFF
jgi:hypothetical protein